MSVTFSQFYPGNQPALAMLHLAVQVTLILGVALFALWLVRRRGAACRHSLALSGLAAMIVCPAVVWACWTAHLPGLRLTPPASRLPVGMPVTPAVVPAVGTEVAGEAAPPAPGETIPEGWAAAATPRLDWRPWVGLVFLVWLVGVVAGVLRLVCGYGFQLRLRARAVPVAWSGRNEVLAEISRHLGLRRRLRVATCDLISGPVCVGWWRPLILLPPGLIARLSAAELAAILLHEGAHIRRGDHWIGLVQRLAAIGYWPHPLMHRLNQALSRAREEVCDNYVLQAGSAKAYARTLLRVTEQNLLVREAPAVIGLTQPRWRLEDRVSGLLDRGRDRLTSAGRAFRVLIGIGFVALALLVGGISIRAADLDDLPAAEPLPHEAAEPAAPNPPARESAVIPAARAVLWQTAEWGGRTILTQNPNELQVEVNDPKAGKVCVYQPVVRRDPATVARAEAVIDWQQRKPYPVLVSFALHVGDHYEWIEAPPVILRPGTNRFTFDFRRAEWKSKRTGWHHQTTPLGKGAMRTVNLVFHGLDRGDRVMVKSINLVAAAPAAPTPEDARMGRTEVPELITPRQQPTPDLTRADILRVHVLNLLRIYAADLQALGRGDEAEAMQAAVDEALNVELDQVIEPRAPEHRDPWQERPPPQATE